MESIIRHSVLVVAGLMACCATAFAAATAPEPAPNEGPTVRWGDYKVQINDYGNLGRIFLKWGYGEADAMLARAEAAHVEPNVWKVALVLVPSFDVTWKDQKGVEHHTQATLTPEQMDHCRVCFKRFVQFATAYSGGHLRLATTEFVFPDPVVLVTPPEQKGFFFPPPLKDEMVKAFPDWKPKEFDSVICIFPPGDMPLDAFGRSWGQLHGKLAAGNSNIGYVAERIAPDDTFGIVMQHEWLHQVESVMMDNLGYLGLPNLHDAGLCGYQPGVIGQPQWLVWNRDFMYRLYRPAMWQKADMNSVSWWEPRPKFEDAFIRNWLVRGPFPNKENGGLDVDFLGGEADVLPAPSSEATLPITDNAAWHAVEAPALWDPLPENATDDQRAQRADQDDVVNFAKAFQPNSNSVAYAHVYLHAARSEKALLWIGSDDGVKVFLDGVMVHRNRIDRGAAKDADRVPVILKQGWNRLLIKVDQGAGGWGFCARLSTPDGQPIEGLTTALELPEGAHTEPGEAIPVKWDGKLYAWDAVQDDPWAKLPRLDEAMLRSMTGLDDLAIETAPGVLRVEPGQSPQVLSPVLHKIDPADAQLNNQLTYANESLAWLRYRTVRKDDRFSSDRRDVLLIRWDLIDPWMSWLRSHSAVPADAALAGYVAFQKQVAYVVYTDLGEQVPSRELDLVSFQGGGLTASVMLERADSLTGKIVQAQLSLENASAERATLQHVSAECDDPGVEAIVKSPIENKAIEPGGTIEAAIPLLRVADDAEPGLKLAHVRLQFATADGPVTLEKTLALAVKQPVAVALVVDGPSIVKSGRTRSAKLYFANYAAHLGKVTWHVSGSGVTAQPSSDSFTIRPLPEVTTADLKLKFRPTRRSGTDELLTTLDVAEPTVPDSRRSLTVHVGGKDKLLQCTFDKELDGWRKGTGTYSVERRADGAFGRKGYAFISDGGGCKYGNVVIFGPAAGEEQQWNLAYSSDEYPMVEFNFAAKDTGNTALIVLADGAWYDLVLTGEFVEMWGSRVELGSLGFAPDGAVHKVSFNLDEALDRVAGQGDHAVQQIWIGDTKTHSSNQWRGPDVGTMMIDDFVIR